MSLRIGVVVATVLLAAQAAAAQTQRPYRALFNGGVGDTEHSVTATASLGSGYTSDVVGDLLETRATFARGVPRRGGGTTAGLSSGLAYSMGSGRVQAGASLASSTRYYPELDRRLLTRYSTGGGASLALFDGLSLRAAARYEPYMIATVLPVLVEPGIGESAAPELDLAVSDQHRLSYVGATQFSRRLSQRASFSANYSYAASDLPNGGGLSRSHSAGSAITVGIARGLGATLGYQYARRLGVTNNGRPAEMHNVLAGLTYNQALSLSRHTTVSFATGSTAVRSGEKMRYHAVGSADLNHALGRTWNATLTYSRNAQFVDIWPDPLLADSLGVSLGGLIGRRVSLGGSARVSRGNIGATRGAPEYTAAHAAVRLGVPISRYVSSGVTYTYASYEFGALAELPGGWHRSGGRHRITADVGVWVPVFHRARRLNAAR